MKFYITLNEKTILEDETEKIKVLLKNQDFIYSILGKYKSRGYITLVIEVVDVIQEDDIISIENKIKNNADVLEMDHYMRYYYTLNESYAPKDINDIIRGKLAAEGYKYKIYISHSQNGILHIGLKILNIDPFNKSKFEELKGLIEGTVGVQKLMIY